jgi:hypothetical protein
VSSSGVVENSLGSSGLTCINVCGNSNVPDEFERVASRHVVFSCFTVLRSYGRKHCLRPMNVSI